MTIPLRACKTKPHGSNFLPQIVAVGCSTGGPGALVQLLSSLPPEFEPPIIVAQHIEARFQSHLFEWLAGESTRTVRIPVAGEPICAKTVYLAPATVNMSISQDFCVTTEPLASDQIYTPNIDHLFHNLARLTVDASAVLLTGMGRDGALGLKVLAEHGWLTYVQSKETCAVSGMPSAALELSCRHTTGSPTEIGARLRATGLAYPRRCP
jgi:two-component system, chemotaxis family, response regulator WspF